MNPPPQPTAPLALAQALQQAITQHQAGLLGEAELLYRNILQQYPQHPETNYHLGILCVQMNQPIAGLPYFMGALEADPTQGAFWLGYIDALIQANQLDAAREVLAIARQQGLQGAEFDNLTLHLAPQVISPAPARQHTKKSLTGKLSREEQTNAIIALFSQGQYAEVVKLGLVMTARYPRDGFGWKALGSALQAVGRNTEALTALQKAAKLTPHDVYAHSNLANALNDLGRYAEAEHSLRRALTIDPNFAEAHSNLGSTLQDMGRLTEAVASYQRAIGIKPDLAEAHYNLGNLYRTMGHHHDAIAAYRLALAIQPDYAQAHSNLGITLHESGQPAEAETAVRRALQIQPNLVQAHSNLGNILQDSGRLIEAESCYRRALQLNPNIAEIHSNLGIVLQELGLLTDAENCHRSALQIDPNLVSAHNSLGNTLQALNRLTAAAVCYHDALALNPDNTTAHSSLLLMLNYDPLSKPEQNFAEALRYGQTVSRQVKQRYKSWQCDRQASKLRIGFVSGDFNNHPVGYFLENLLKGLDPAIFELVAYPTNHRTDTLTTRIQPYFCAWHPLLGLSDEAAAKLIHDDSIHILFDLAGHTRYHRLPIFAWKPAPVQVSWLGYFATTGMAEMDYLIADPWTLPESEAINFTETIWRLPETRLCFTPPNIDVPISPLPALANGYITFGCFNNLTKMNDEVVALWAQILTALPDSKLFLKSKQLNDHSQQQLTLNRYVQHGIAEQRLILEGQDDRATYLRAYNRVDIALDPFPYPGGTTTVEGLWMGVPVLTLAGESFLSRQGAGILMNAGLAEWVATNKDEYITQAISHAQDLQSLATLRKALRQQLLNSPLFNAAHFAQHFGQAMMEMQKQTFDQTQSHLLTDSLVYDQTNPTSQSSVLIVSATRLSETDFWRKSALGISLQRHLKLDNRLSTHIAFENSRGLPEIYNECIHHAEETTLVFMHDDVWIDETDSFANTIMAGLEQFDVIGVAGNRRRIPNQPAWAFINSQLTWDDKSNLSGYIAHGKDALGTASYYGTVPAKCELLDGVFLAVKKSSLKKNNVKFDAQFDFHFYDMDFCRSAREAGLMLGTWLIKLTHQSGGAFGSPQWRNKYQCYLKKWETNPSDQYLQQVANYHQAGDLQNAERILLDILQTQPNNAVANHTMGVIKLQTEQALASLPYFIAALEADPTREQFWLSYIGALIQADQLKSARQVLTLAKQYGLQGDAIDVLSTTLGQSPYS